MSEQAELAGRAGARGCQAGRMVGPVVSVRGLRKSYGAMAAVRGIDLEIEAAEIVALALALRTFCWAGRSRS